MKVFFSPSLSLFIFFYFFFGWVGREIKNVGVVDRLLFFGRRTRNATSSSFLLFSFSASTDVTLNAMSVSPLRRPRAAGHNRRDRIAVVVVAVVVVV